MKTAFPARLHVLLARDAPMGVIFRRGPSKEVGCFLWNRATDTFVAGQWLRGRIYERRSDLSPDGRFLLYFAMNGKWNSETGGSWTAISRPPWLKAISLFGKGDCWEGGGLFLSEDSFWLNDRYFSRGRILKESAELRREDNYVPPQSYGAEDTGVYYVRLQRDGWSLVGYPAGAADDRCAVFEKSLACGLRLRKVAHEQVGSPPGKGCYWDEHELLYDDGHVEGLRDWEWADLDRGRLVWAEGGCLFAASDVRQPLVGKVMLHDFNGYAPAQVEAPY